MEGDLRDEQWELIAPLLPPHKKRGRPRAEDRRTLNGIPSASSGQTFYEVVNARAQTRLDKVTMPA